PFRGGFSIWISILSEGRLRLLQRNNLNPLEPLISQLVRHLMRVFTCVVGSNQHAVQPVITRRFLQICGKVPLLLELSHQLICLFGSSEAPNLNDKPRVWRRLRLRFLLWRNLRGNWCRGRRRRSIRGAYCGTRHAIPLDCVQTGPEGAQQQRQPDDEHRDDIFVTHVCYSATSSHLTDARL